VKVDEVRVISAIHKHRIGKLFHQGFTYINWIVGHELQVRIHGMKRIEIGGKNSESAQGLEVFWGPLLSVIKNS